MTYKEREREKQWKKDIEGERKREKGEAKS